MNKDGVGGAFFFQIVDGEADTLLWREGGECAVQRRAPDKTQRLLAAVDTTEKARQIVCGGLRLGVC